MSKVKLNLRAKDFAGLATFAKAHRDAMVGNANFPTPDPTAAVFDAKYTAYDDKLDEVTAAEVALETLRAERDDLRVELEASLNARGAYVERVSEGDAAKIFSAAFEIQATGSPTTSMPKPMNLTATMGDDEGAVDVGCHAVAKGKSYIWEMREHSDTAAPGPWQSAKVSGRSSATVTGLVSGKKYAFRVRVLGPNDLESPWSDEVVCMAP